MRTTLVTILLITLSVSASFGLLEPTQVSIEAGLPRSLSGTTNSGIDFSSISGSAGYGIIGAAFLILSVIKRRKDLSKLKP